MLIKLVFYLILLWEPQFYEHFNQYLGTKLPLKIDNELCLMALTQIIKISKILIEILLYRKDPENTKLHPTHYKVP